jgi:hypothetical protein
LFQGVLLAGNPCSKEGVAQGKRYFVYPDSTNKFIQCNEWGGAYIVSCQGGYEWSQEKQTCVMAAMEEQDNQVSFNQVMEENGQTMNGFNPDVNVQPVDSMYGSTGQYEDMDGEYVRIQEEENTMPAYGMSDGAYADMDGEYVRVEQEQEMPAYGMSDGAYADMDGQYVHIQEEEPMEMPAYGMSDGAYADMDGEYVRTMETAAQMEETPEEAMPVPISYGGLKPSMYGYGPMYGYMKSGDSVPSRNPIHLITCSMTKLMYMPHYINPHWYYECVQGAYKLKSCNADEMWSQKRQRCESMATTTTTTTTTTPAPTTTTTTMPMPSGKKSYYSPCLSPKVKTMPYPGDEQRYVVCHSKYSWEVRWCSSGEIWLNPLARCIAISALLPTTEKQDQTNPTPPPVTTPTTAEPTGMDKYNKLCMESDSFYHAYEEDNTKYIQCDEFKKAYLRECGPFKVWDDARKTCVGRTDIDGSSSTTPAPMTTTQRSGVSSNNGNTIITFSTSIQTTGDGTCAGHSAQ